MGRKTRAVTSREFKIMLHPDRFSGSQEDAFAAANQFVKDLKDDVRNQIPSGDDEKIVKGSFDSLDEDKHVTVQFLDTKERELRNANLVFRQRQHVDGGDLELTLKYRHPDRFLSSGTDVGGNKTKFEEDVKTNKASLFVSLHSLSGKVKDVDENTEFATLKDIREFYPPIKDTLGDAYSGSTKLLRVCDFVAIQTVFEGVDLTIAEDYKAECALILWHESGGDPTAPVVVEFSFRHKDKKIGPKEEPFTAAMAKRCSDILKVLRSCDSAVRKWVDLEGPTKTSYAYGLRRSQPSCHPEATPDLNLVAHEAFDAPPLELG